MKLKKTIFTVNVDNFAPEVTEITFPYIKAYAHKIGAEFFEITARKNPDKPPAYEKFQIYDLGRLMRNDWNIFFDADTLIHPDYPDINKAKVSAVMAVGVEDGLFTKVDDYKVGGKGRKVCGYTKVATE